MRSLLAIALVLSVVGVESSAMAQTRGYAVNRLDPAEPGGDWYATESLDLRGTVLPRAGVVGDWTYRSLLRRGADGRDREVLTDQVFVHVRADAVLVDRVRVGIGVPVALFQHGEAPPWPSREQAFGDLRLVADVRLFGSYQDHLRGAAGLAVFLPTGTRDAFTSDGLVRLAPRILLAGSFEAFEWAARAGFVYRPYERVWDGRALGDDVSFGVSAGVKVNDVFVFGPELFGSATVTGPDAFGPRSIPLELLLGARTRIGNHFQIGSAIGGGLTNADGVPKMRVLLTLEYAPDVCVDRDGDGICAYEDACPEVDGVRTGNRKTNGCPADRDHDGIVDRDDKCPDEMGHASVDPESVGCPDRDADGVVDKVDACPDVPGAPDPEPSRNGCPPSAEPADR